MRQYMAKKPTKYGIKVWSLANSVSKYVQRVEFYTCSQQSDEGSRSGYVVVSQLLEGYEGQGHILVCDKFFTSVALFFDLCEKDIFATDTCYTDRVGWPQALTQKDNGERGALLHCMHVSQRIAVVSWCDRKAVNLLSTAASPVEKDGTCFVQLRIGANVGMCPHF